MSDYSNNNKVGVGSFSTTDMVRSTNGGGSYLNQMDDDGYAGNTFEVHADMQKTGYSKNKGSKKKKSTSSANTCCSD